jgi:hypothetical protein
MSASGTQDLTTASGTKDLTITPVTQIECKKKFERTNHILHIVHKVHNMFGIFIWGIIIFLLLDHYYHFFSKDTTHTYHGIILWVEAVCYTLFLAIPFFIGAYKMYKIKASPAKCKKILINDDIKSHLE